jgi:diguanylate cyclase (GGDEF)-like protein
VQIGTFLFRYLATADDLEPLYQSTVYSMMTRDGLTRVFNRRYLTETLRREVARCKRYARPISMVMINIDQFTAINERFGKLIGDQVLRLVAKRLESVLRQEDMLARIGGDTFALAMVEADLEDAAEISERCRVAVGCEPIVTPVGPIRVTISLGIAARPATGLESSAQASESSRSPKRHEAWGSDEELMAEALDRLQEAKRAGRNRTVC